MTDKLFNIDIQWWQCQKHDCNVSKETHGMPVKTFSDTDIGVFAGIYVMATGLDNHDIVGTHETS